MEAWTHYNEWGLITHNAVLKCGQRELDLVKRYATHDYDSVLELYYAKARFYDAHDRHFTAVDPILDPSGYDLREYVQNPVQFVQYLYVVNNPIIFTDLLGLNPTNALLNIDWSKVLTTSGNADNVIGQEQYVSLDSVWKQIKEYYPSAYTYSNNGYSVYTVSDGGNYIQFQKPNNKNIIEVSMMKNGKVETHSLSLRSILNNNFISKNSLERYFRKVWCEDYYLNGMSTFEQKGVLSALKKDINNLSTEAAQDSYRALMTYIITGSTGKYTSYATASLKVEPYTVTQTEKLREKAFLQTAALFLKTPYDTAANVIIELLAEEDGNVESVITNAVAQQILDKIISGVPVDDALKERLKKDSSYLDKFFSVLGIIDNITTWKEVPGTYIELLTFANGDWRQVGYLLDANGSTQRVHLWETKIMDTVSYSGRIGIEYSTLKKSPIDSFFIPHLGDMIFYNYEVNTIYETISTSTE